MLPSCRAQMQQQSCGSSRVLPLTLLYWRMRGSRPRGCKAAARRMWGQPAARLQGCRQAHVGFSPQVMYLSACSISSRAEYLASLQRGRRASDSSIVRPGDRSANPPDLAANG